MVPRVTCLVCHKERSGLLPIQCSCGNTIGYRAAPIPIPNIPYNPPPRDTRRSDICRTNECGYCNGRQCQKIIDVKAKRGEAAGGWITFLDNSRKTRCPAENPMWFVGKIGFISTSYCEIGGTEIFHRTLVPNLSGVAGFVALQESLASGDPSLLGCQYGKGLAAAQRLARDADVLYVWGIGNDLPTVLGPHRPKVVSVSHCDSRNEWTRNFLLEQEPYTDKFVYINKDGLGSVPDHRRDDAVLISNGIDKKRTVQSRTREQTRSDYNVPHDATLGVMVTRYSSEKKVLEAMLAVRETPHYLLVAGNANVWNEPYLKMLQTIETDRVRLVPAVDHPGNLLHAADYYLSTSEYEGFGLSVGEAMMAGLQVISPPIGIVEDHPNTAHLLPMDPGVDAIKQAVLSPEDTRAAASEVIKDYTSQHCIAKWQRLFDGLA